MKIKKVQCIFCAKIFKTKYNEKFCSEECRNEIYPRSKGYALRFSVLERDNFRCVYCGASSRKGGVRLVVDHIFPIIKGGDNSLGNMATACNECNIGKRDRILKNVPEGI